mmetsp:Transcript_13710/g.39104  ORF Transcript_13710/g.39104 Transcript_13710/m.39104 type:complete len:216 (-) Transcript_13710:11-658(-)
MPRFVVPMELLEASASRMPSMSWWLSMSMCVRVEMKTRSEARGSNSFSASSSRISVGRWQATPLPMRFLQLLLIIPQGSRWKAYFLPSTTRVWPALAPPLNLAQSCTSCARMSTSLPLPSSPHWAPRTTQNFQGFLWPSSGGARAATAEGEEELGLNSFCGMTGLSPTSPLLLDLRSGEWFLHDVLLKMFLGSIATGLGGGRRGWCGWPWRLGEA